MKRISVFALSVAALITSAGIASAQTYPARAGRIVVPFPPGGGADAIARPLGQRLSELTAQQFVIDNRPGANANIGAEHVARSAPDGYTMLMANSSLTISATLYRKLAYDPQRDLAPAALMGITPSVLVVHPSLPVRALKEFVALAKSRPGKLNFGSSGVGSTMHLGAEMLKARESLSMIHVPYKGGGPAVSDLLGGQIEFLFVNPIAVLGPIQTGKLRGLAVTSLKRVKALPDTPTFDESGLPGFESNTFYGVIVPAATPKEIVARINALIAGVVSEAAFQERMVAMGYDPMPGSPEQFASFLRKDIADWAKAIQASGTRAE